MAKTQDNNRIILGLDPGFAIVGYGLIQQCANSGELAKIASGTLQTPKYEDLSVRLASIEEQLLKVIDTYKPTDIAIEELFFAKNVKTAINVAHARGVILLTAIKMCGRLYEYTPLQVKLAITGYGKADKKQIQYMVKMLLNLKDLSQDDEADALAIAITHANST
ncbi:MAG: crossover junction endodeoxyribonuclease RuvC [Firmicutes bacterium]|nr:crossover junction endodeoxyribonuclease RuvC [Bacillota bacterium]